MKDFRSYRRARCPKLELWDVSNAGFLSFVVFVFYGIKRVWRFHVALLVNHRTVSL